MNKLNSSILIGALALSVGVAVSAQTPPEQPKGDRAHKMHERMKAADKDGDGKISRAEAAALPRIAKHFDEIDTNKDGFLTKEELQAYRAKHGPPQKP